MSYYTEFTVPVGEAGACPCPSDKRIDLISGVEVFGVACDAPVNVMHQTEYFNTPTEKFTLTNGVKPEKVQYLDPAFTHFTCGSGREIYYRLPYMSAVTGFAMSFLNEDDVGIGMPHMFRVSLSADGKSWQRVYRADSISEKKDFYIHTEEATFGKTYKACWLKIEFDIPLHCWAESVSLFGTTAIPADAVTPVDDGSVNEKENAYINKYPEYSELGDTHNIVLAYNCMPVDYDDVNRISSFSTEEMLRYVGYYDKNGELKDTFFDGFLFLPYSRFTYSKYYKCAEGWKYYVDNTFAEGRNVDAAEEAAGIVGEKLGLADYKVKLFFSILHTKVRYGDFPEKFGDLDGDGVDEDMTSYNDREKAVKWIIDRQIERFGSKERKHTEIGGFYWFEEGISYRDPFELKLLAFARKYLHGLGYKLIWIPYYQAPGYKYWKENGFDIACMQPNYAFQKKEPAQRLYDNAELTKKLGMCVELEINSYTDEIDINRYKDYLDAGAETGYMNTIKMYYQGGRDFYGAYKSADAFSRSVYDDTYLFAKEKLVKAIRKG